jgi:hypothetical protein
MNTMNSRFWMNLLRKKVNTILSNIKLKFSLQFTQFLMHLLAIMPSICQILVLLTEFTPTKTLIPKFLKNNLPFTQKSLSTWSKKLKWFRAKNYRRKVSQKFPTNCNHSCLKILLMKFLSINSKLPFNSKK